MKSNGGVAAEAVEEAEEAGGLPLQRAPFRFLDGNAGDLFMGIPEKSQRVRAESTGAKDVGAKSTGVPMPPRRWRS